MGGHCLTWQRTKSLGYTCMVSFDRANQHKIKYTNIESLSHVYEYCIITDQAFFLYFFLSSSQQQQQCTIYIERFVVEKVNN